jgi:carboxylesterase type B
MSVLLFAPAAYANAARALVELGACNTETAARTLAAVHLANVKAFRRSYAHRLRKIMPVEPVSAADIIAAMPEKADHQAARIAATLFDYNTEAQDGTRFLTSRQEAELVTFLAPLVRTLAIA